MAPQSITFRPNYGAVDAEPNSLAFVINLKDNSAVMGVAVIDSDRMTLTAQDATTPWNGEFRWSLEAGNLHIRATHEAGPDVTLEPAANQFLLMRRGFHWINERPYNR